MSPAAPLLCGSQTTPGPPPGKGHRVPQAAGPLLGIPRTGRQSLKDVRTELGGGGLFFPLSSYVSSHMERTDSTTAVGQGRKDAADPQNRKHQGEPAEDIISWSKTWLPCGCPGWRWATCRQTPRSVFLFPPRDDERETRPHPHLRRAPLGCGRGHSLGFHSPCAQPHARSAWP